MIDVSWASSQLGSMTSSYYEYLLLRAYQSTRKLYCNIYFITDNGGASDLSVGNKRYCELEFVHIVETNTIGENIESVITTLWNGGFYLKRVVIRAGGAGGWLISLNLFVPVVIMRGQPNSAKSVLLGINLI